MSSQLPLLGLLEDVLLPGEERRFEPPAADAATIGAFGATGVLRVCAVTVASRVELPTLLAQRWATEASVVKVEGGAVLLRGERRVRIRSATGKEAPYTAVVDDAEAMNKDDAALKQSLAAAVHELAAAVECNGLLDDADGLAKVEAFGAAALRALVTAEELKRVAEQPIAEAIRGAASRIAAATRPHAASCKLEETVRKLAAQPTPSDGLRRRLWAQVVEIQSSLDVYDPAVTVEDGDELGSLQRKLQQAGLPKRAREVAKRELKLLRGMNKDHHDYSVYVSHLHLMSRLAWHANELPPVTLDTVREVLDRDHAGLEKAKQRILEYLAVRALGGECRSTVLCFAGPPGVGKTSVARAIADALGRKFVRVALGGVHDECELRGHRMTFQAAMPGRVIAGLARVGTSTPVVLLDELDKVGADRTRSPNGALLEMLDPEQNASFHDNYLAVPYDLSQVLFICTANDLSAIPETLRDRLDTIELDGYTVAEKVQIASGYLMRRLATDHGLPQPLAIEPAAVVAMIEGHTRESGVRQLQRALAAIHRARALALVKAGPTSEPPLPIAMDEVRTVLGAPKHQQPVTFPQLPMGVCTGLSVGAHGGSVLFIEVGRMRGRGGLHLTGSLGEVLREAAGMALAHVRVHLDSYGLTQEDLRADFHVHVPDAATSKDGPSAGIALVLGFLSCLRRVAVPGDVAVTGEVTLSGRVLPVGGVRAKLLAAARAGAKRVVLPASNVSDVPEGLTLEVIGVETMAEAVRQVFGEEFFQGAFTAPQPGRRHNGPATGNRSCDR